MHLKLGVKVALTAVLVAGTGTAVYAAYETGMVDKILNKNGVEVQNFVDKDKRIAEIWAKKNDLSDTLKYTYEYSEDKAENIVLKQSVKAGKKISSGDTFTLTVSKGFDPDKEFEFPDFTDKKKEDIEAWFTDNHFTSVTYAYEAVEDTSKEEDSFISASVEKGTKVKRSAAIEIKLVTKDIVVPDLANMSKEDIQAWGDKWNVTISFEEQEDSMREEGTIISVSAAKDSKVKAGDTITVKIAKKKSEDERSNQETSNQQTDNNANSKPRDDNDDWNGGSTNTENGGGSTSGGSSEQPQPQPQVCPVNFDAVKEVTDVPMSRISNGVSYLLKKYGYDSCSFTIQNNSSTTSEHMNAVDWWSDGYSGVVYIVDNIN